MRSADRRALWGIRAYEKLLQQNTFSQGGGTNIYLPWGDRIKKQKKREKDSPALVFRDLFIFWL